MYCRETSDIATHLAALSKLREYFASYTNITNQSMDTLSQILSLEEITFYGWPGITDEGVMLLARLPGQIGLPANQVFKTLCAKGDDGAFP